MRRALGMFRNAVLGLLMIALAGTLFLWGVQTAGPIPLRGGPEYLGVEWYLDPRLPYTNWQFAYSGRFRLVPTSSGSQVMAAEVSVDEAPPLYPALPERSLLVGASNGNLDFARACFVRVRGQATRPGTLLVDVTYIPLLQLPFWLLAVALAGAPAFLLGHAAYERYRGAKRRKTGLCSHCGYNLTGNVSGRCPECGTPTDPEAV